MKKYTSADIDSMLSARVGLVRVVEQQWVFVEETAGKTICQAYTQLHDS